MLNPGDQSITKTPAFFNVSSHLCGILALHRDWVPVCFVRTASQRLVYIRMRKEKVLLTLSRVLEMAFSCFLLPSSLTLDVKIRLLVGLR